LKVVVKLEEPQMLEILAVLLLLKRATVLVVLALPERAVVLVIIGKALGALELVVVAEFDVPELAVALVGKGLEIDVIGVEIEVDIIAVEPEVDGVGGQAVTPSALHIHAVIPAASQVDNCGQVLGAGAVPK